jgi:uncharacterized protein (TIGR03083 family)
MTDNGAGQDGGFKQQGMKATEALGETWRSLSEACWELSSNEWALPTECPGWDVKDQLSHLIGIERSIMGEAPPEWDGRRGNHVKNDVAAVNESWVAVRRPLEGAAVRAEFVEVTEARLAQLGELTEGEWAAVGWSPVGQVPYAVFMEVRVFDSFVHEQDARRALDRPGGSGNLASAISLGRVESAMPFVVGKKAACTDGTSVRFDIAGPRDDGRVFTVGVEGARARVVDGDVVPTVTLSLSSLDFLRLGCGRATAEEVGAAGGIAMEGDADVGRRVLAAMNFMF